MRDWERENALPFGDPAKRWPATAIDGKPTYQIALKAALTKPDPKPRIEVLTTERFRKMRFDKSSTEGPIANHRMFGHDVEYLGIRTE